VSDPERLRARIREVDERIDRLSARNAGFDLGAEIRRLRALLSDRDADREDRPEGRFASKRERVERIRELQRRREELLAELAECEGGNARDGDDGPQGPSVSDDGTRIDGPDPGT
jgi:DNA-binding transcriptional MerR regulator